MRILKYQQEKLIKMADKIADLSNQIEELLLERKHYVNQFRTERSKRNLRLIK